MQRSTVGGEERRGGGGLKEMVSWFIGEKQAGQLKETSDDNQ